MYRMTGIGMLVFLRSHYFYVYQKNSERIVENMKKIFTFSTKTGFTEKSMTGYVNMTNKITLIFLISALFFGESFAVARLILGDYENRKLPYPMWYPFDWKSSPIYEVTCTQQLICHLLIIILECGVDTFYTSSLLLTIGQIELLGWEFRNIMFSALLDCGVEKGRAAQFQRQFINEKRDCGEFIMQPTPEAKEIYDDVYDVIDTSMFSNSLINRFKKLIQFHQVLKLHCADLEDFFSPLMLIFTMVFTMITLFSLYFMVNSEQLQNDIYDIPWYLGSKRFKSSIMILQVGVKRPVALTIGKFASLSLSTSLWILRTGFSYTAILRQITE